MPRRPAAAQAGRNSSRTHLRRTRKWRLWPRAAQRKRWLRALRRAPRGLQIGCVLGILGGLSLGINWIYQVVRKPSELFFPVSGALYKTPGETWRDYEPAFTRYSTAVMTPELLAALAQVEGSGNPIVRTYWRWSWSLRPFEVYRPASSAVGMYQITDGTFAEARHYCIHGHAVAQDGPWNDWHSCWFSRLYLRVLPGDAVELTSAYLDHEVASALERHGLSHATLPQKQELAAVIHLCGAGAGDTYARRHFRLAEGQRCGDHDVRTYVARVEAMRKVFSRLAATDQRAGL